MNQDKLLRGSNFLNRIRIDLNLTTISPLHIGSGDTTTRRGLKKSDDSNELVLIDAVQTDFSGKPYIPGSTIKGNIRNWLLNVFRMLNKNGDDTKSDTIAWNRDFEESDFKTEYEKQKDQIIFMKEHASILERLFGTSFSNSKLDFWDAPCATNSNSLQPDGHMPHEESAPFWSKNRLTYITQSVVIDPETGTAAEKKLYHFELVPKGVTFKMTICGQNIDNMELGLLLFALKAFKSEIWPVTMGAMTGRGYGRFDYNDIKIYMLNNENINSWFIKSIENDHAGFEGLTEYPVLKQNDLIEEIKQTFLKSIGGNENG